MLPNYYSNFSMSLTLNFRHTLAYSRLIQSYSFLLGHIKNPSIFRTILVLRKSSIRLFITPAYSGKSCFWHVKDIFKTLHTLKHISPHSGIFRVLVQLDIFMYVKAYTKPMASSVIFRTVDILSQFQTFLKSNPCIF